MSVALSSVLNPEVTTPAGSLSRNENGGINADLELSGLNPLNGQGSLLTRRRGALADQATTMRRHASVRAICESEVLTLTGDNSKWRGLATGDFRVRRRRMGTPGQPNR